MKNRCELGWLSILLTLTAAPVFAQDDVARGDTVLSRARPDYDPIGMRVGGFILYPDLQVQESYDSNIYATQTNEKSDFITSIEPSVDLKSNWNNHALNFHADSRVVKYADHDTESFTDYTVGFDGKVDVYHDARLYGGLAYKIRHESRTSPNSSAPLTGHPTEYSDLAATVAGEKEFNRLSLRVDGFYDRYDYSNQAGGTVVGSSGFPVATVVGPANRRNYDDKRFQVKAGYEFAPLRQVYLLGGYDWRSYSSSIDAVGEPFNRSSNGYTVAVGAQYDLTGIIFADGFVGYRQQNYREPLGTLAAPTGGLKLTWNVTRLTTITGSFTRDVQETILVGSTGYFASRAELKADHELLRNLLLNVSGGYENDDFKFITPNTSRSDNYYFTGFGAKYLINHNFWLSGGYTYQTRSTNVPFSDFDDHIVFLRVSAHL